MARRHCSPRAAHILRSTTFIFHLILAFGSATYQGPVARAA